MKTNFQSAWDETKHEAEFILFGIAHKMRFDNFEAYDKFEVALRKIVRLEKVELLEDFVQKIEVMSANYRLYGK